MRVKVKLAADADHRTVPAWVRVTIEKALEGGA